MFKQRIEPHPDLVPLLDKYGISWDLFSKKGRLPEGLKWVKEKRSNIITEMHSNGTSWGDMIEITGLSLGSIERLTKAMWNDASRKNSSVAGVRVGKSWKGKHRPGQLERQWASGTFDSPSTRAKWSATMVQVLLKYPKYKYPHGESSVVPTLKGQKDSVRVRSSFEKKAIEILDQNPDVLSYQYEMLLRLPSGKQILPDFVVSWVDGAQTLIEVKPAYILKDKQRYASHIARLGIAEQEAFARGWSFLIWSEKELGL